MMDGLDSRVRLVANSSAGLCVASQNRQHKTTRRRVLQSAARRPDRFVTAAPRRLLIAESSRAPTVRAQPQVPTSAPTAASCAA
ncbi:hypothetical protein CDD83_4892 [Cordyceps sp. RAO-2017]|nr:hypothetical protein CDD83_4892 [Cordyceps sp. RAO-2017]